MLRTARFLKILVLCFDDRLLDVQHVAKETNRLNVDLLRALLNEAATSIGIVGCDLLLYLADA